MNCGVPLPGAFSLFSTCVTYMYANELALIQDPASIVELSHHTPGL